MKRHRTSRIFIVCLLWCATYAPMALACPEIGVFIDFNCDERIRYLITGDSVVNGVGDTEQSGGYVKRLRRTFPAARFINLGIRGITSRNLLRNLKKNSKRENSRTAKKMIASDVVIIDVGRNDYWEERGAALTVATIRRIVGFLRKNIGKDEKARPRIIIAALLPTTREYQSPFITEVNTQLLQLNPDRYEVALRFDTLDPSVISDDGLHPSSSGYDSIADMVADYINPTLQDELASERADSDSDGVYDYFETKRYMTDPSNADTDGDTILDGVEIFIDRTNPLVAN